MNKLPIIEFHILQSFPVSCLNRDDVGSPKSVIVGGVERARVSSQCWKRAVRQQLHELGLKLGIRTKRVEALLKTAILEKTSDEKAAEECAKAVAAFLSDDSLLFLTDKEYESLANYIETKAFDAKSVKDKEVYKLLSKAKNDALDGLDIALFGRMVAKASALNVEAACAFSHAISTHASESELDFFTALDDEAVKDPASANAGHMGTSEYVSATYYRYISLNLNKLAETLGIDDSKDLKVPVEAFVKALYLAVPSARQATMSASNTWDFAKILIRNGQRLQCSFDQPVRAPREGGYLTASVEKLNAELARKEKQCGSLYGKVASFDFGLNDDSIDDLVSNISATLEKL